MEIKPLEAHCLSRSTLPSPLAKELEQHTRASIPGSNMLIGEMEASLIMVLLNSIRAMRVLELGTFTGYSALVMAEALPADGKITTIDVNPGTTELAKSFWKRSPHGHKIEAILTPGIEYLPTLNENFDFIFVDADKVNYPFYVTWAREHLNPGGMMVIDNSLWSGRVIQPDPDAHTKGILEATAIAHGWQECVTSLLPVRDGMMLIQKRTL